MYSMGLSQESQTPVKFELDSNGRSLELQRVIQRNFQSKTMQQMGMSYFRWTGSLAFDDANELTALQGFYTSRSVWFHDQTLGGSLLAVLCHWKGDFRKEYDDPMAQSGRVHIELEQVVAQYV